MKFKRLIAAVLTAVMAVVSTVGMTAFTSSAANVSYTEYMPDGQTFSAYITNHITSTRITMPAIAVTSDGYYPSLISADAFKTLRNLYNTSGVRIQAEFTLTDPDFNARYYVSIDNMAVAQLPDNSSVFRSGINLAISIGVDNTYVDAHGTKIKGVKITGTPTILAEGYGGLNLRYDINGDDWNERVLRTLVLEENVNMNYYSLAVPSDPYSEKINIGVAKRGANAGFYISDETMSGVHFVNDPFFQYYTRTETDEILRKRVIEILGYVDTKYEGLTSEMQTYVDNAVANLKLEIQQSGYLTEDNIDELLDNYYKDPDHLKELADAIISKEGLSGRIDDEIYRAFGYDASTKTASELEAAVKSRILEYVGEFVGTAQTPTTRIADVIKAVVTDDYINRAVGDLKNEIDAINRELEGIGYEIVSINKTLEYLDYLKSQFGTSNVAETLSYINNLRNQFGSSSVADILSRIDELEKRTETKPVDGKDGQSFTDWAIQNYQSVDNFINYIANLVAAKTKDGASAYEVALKNGFKGTEKEWLDSLKGKDAYQLAVELGFVGSEQDWLDSLKGEDGEDGEIIYVNGAYNNLPDSTIDDTDDDDVTVEEDEEEDEEGDVTVEEDEEDDALDEETEDGDEEVVADDEGGDDAGDDDGDEETVSEDEKPSKKDDKEDEIYIVDDNTKPANPGYHNNPATGVAIGIIIPAAGIGSVLLLKKSKRRRGRK